MSGASISVIPSVVDALVALAKGLVDANTVVVSDGYPITDDTADTIAIGVQDPRSEDQAMSASSQQRWVSIGAQGREEDGEVTCAILVNEGGSGDTGMKAARDRAFGYAGQVAVAMRANPTLGLPGLVQAEFGVQLDYYSNQTPQGAEATVIFHVHFQARV